MKLITAVIKPHALSEVVSATTCVGAHGLTVTDVRGFGQEYGHDNSTAAVGKQAFMLPKLRLDFVVRDEDAEPVTEAIVKAACSGAIGDGKIWVCDVEGAVRIRTGERDRDAI